MRFSLIISLLTMLQVTATSWSQTTRLSMHANDINIREAFREIEKNSGMSFLYYDEVIDLNKTISISADDFLLTDLLDELLKNTTLTYRILDSKFIVVSPNSKLQQQKISGTITDVATGEPLPGVYVIIDGTNTGAITDSDGKYVIEVPGQSDVLVFSYIGYVTERIRVEGKLIIDVALTPDIQTLEEVVVVGYGEQKKVNLTGAVDVVKGDAFENRSITSVASGLQGLLPGLNITSPSGQPGNLKTTIVVRGINTINSDTDPLVLIDGVSGGSLDLLNPDDIESVSVLKDAASAAIYGARAATGVILITTKSGHKAEKVRVSYSGYVGIQTPTTMPEMVNGRDFMTLSNEARANAGLAEVYSSEAFDLYDSGGDPNNYSNTDWMDAIYKGYSTQYSHNLNISGGTEKGGYYMSYGYLNQDGLIVGDPYKSDRHNVRVRVNTEFAERLKLDGNLSYIDFFKQDAAASGTAGVFRLAQRISPLLPVMWQQQNADNSWTDTEYYSYGSVSNPVYVANESGYSRLTSRIVSGSFNADLKIINGLNLKAQYTINHEGDDTHRYAAALYKYKPDGTEDSGNSSLTNDASESYYSYLSQTMNSTLNYIRTIGNHSLVLLAGISKEWGINNWITASRQNIISEGVEVVSGGTENIENSASGAEWTMLSYFGRLNYNFAEKYLVEANIRRDGTSRFSEDNRWGTFPSFSFGWKFSEEGFMQFTKPFLTMGKLRASWGELGNQNVGSYYPYLTSLTMVDNSYPFGGNQMVGIYQPTVCNSNIKWETLEMLNFGLDVQLFNNRFGLSFDWFKKNNKDAILKPIYPASLGTTSTDNLPYVNMGEIENRGWELSLSWSDRIGEVKYGARFNLSDSKNKVLDLGKSEPYLGTDAYRNVGDPLNAYYGYKTDGLYQEDDFEYRDASTGTYMNPLVPTLSDLAQPGDVKYLDISGENGIPDGVIDDYDKAIIGERYPRYHYSFKGDIAWKNVDFSFYLQGVGKVNGYLEDEARHCFINDYSIPQTSHLDRWTPNNTGASYPRLYYAQTHNREVSDYWIEDASYFRVKNIQLGYTVPLKFSQKVLVEKFRVYLSADNLFTMTDYYEAYDPEIRASSGDSYPQVKTFIVGVNVTFK